MEKHSALRNVIQFGFAAMMLTGCKSGQSLFNQKQDVCRDFAKMYYTDLPPGTEGPEVENLMTGEDEPARKNLIYKDPRGGGWKLRFVENQSGYELHSFVYATQNDGGKTNRVIEFKDYMLQEEIKPLNDTSSLFRRGKFSTFKGEAGYTLRLLLPHHDVSHQPGPSSMPLKMADDMRRIFGFEENIYRSRLMP